MSQHVPVWTAAPQRRIPQHGLDQKPMLHAWLDLGRKTIIGKTRDLPETAAQHNPTRSNTTLVGIVKHLTTVEQHWFHSVLGGDQVEMLFDLRNPDGDWIPEDGETLAVLLDRYRVACRRSDEVIDRLDLDSTGAQTEGDYTLRWALCHVCIDTARHCGHADILREQYDGERGW